jgi:hypothetical protein
LKRFGYIHESELTEEYLCLEIGKLIGDTKEAVVDKKAEEVFFQDMARVDRVDEILRSIMAKDMIMDFSATGEQRPLIHGAYARTAYIHGRIMKARQ